jgi:hypothetical protein
MLIIDAIDAAIIFIIDIFAIIDAIPLLLPLFFQMPAPLPLRHY